MTLSLRPFCLILCLYSLCMVSSCGDSFSHQFDQNFRAQLVFAEADNACGQVTIAALIPDCPVEGLCFTSACEGHNDCYATCGVDLRTCDQNFFNDMISLCAQSLSIDDPNFLVCRYTALSYWLVVQQLGVEAYEKTQELACPDNDLPTNEPPPVTGACCQPGSPPVCLDNTLFVACPTDSVFITDVTCDEVNELFGGCPIPENDKCQLATPICENQEVGALLGRCAGDVDMDRGGGVCSQSLQDCTNGRACLPADSDVFRCTVETDNRLASTDGPQAGGACAISGADAFQADVWYQYVAPCDGTLTIRMCDAITYDAMLAVYGSHTPDAECICPTDDSLLLECNDDFCGSASTVSGVTIEGVQAGACYTIRVGGWSGNGIDTSASRGMSEIDIGVVCATTNNSNMTTNAAP